MNAKYCYLLPIRRTIINISEINEFKSYFSRLKSTSCELIVVDGSPTEVFNKHAAEWNGLCKHIGVDPRYKYLNGKVNGIHSGVDICTSEMIIAADDDIRHTPEDIGQILAHLKDHDMVRPQNYFSPLPWWSMMESSRMLLNRAFIKEGDYSGTIAFTRSAFTAAGDYDGDVLFDNEEIVRHFLAKSLKVFFARDLFILKKPSTYSKWLEQRPRQAYEDFVMKAKTVFFLLLLPLVILMSLFDPDAGVIFTSIVCIGSIILAAKGRDGKAKRYFPFKVIFLAPIWILERSISTYLALYWKIRYNGYPFGEKILSKGTGYSWNKKPAIG